VIDTFDPTDTIAAVASPPGPGLRGLVRLAGPSAWAIALAGFDEDGGAGAPERAELRTGRLKVDGSSRSLPASIALWPAPRTYTRQPLAEIHTVGSPPLLQLVLAHCLGRGARPAQPGEFTLRAFLSGRIDLTRAEAVLDVIEARSPAPLEAALERLAGGLAGPVAGLRDRLLDVLAHLEAGLDFVEEADVEALARRSLAGELAQAGTVLAGLADRLASRDRADERPRVALVGPPNAGKSRLFNALLGVSRALVSPQAGTTRDYVSAPCACDGLSVELIDTAGIEPAETPIATRAQAFREAQALAADLLLVCLSADTNPAQPREPDPREILVWTKSDLATPPSSNFVVLPTSSQTGAGLQALKTEIATRLNLLADEASSQSTMGARCRDHLLRARESVDSAAMALEVGHGEELIAIDLRLAVDELGKVVGAVVTDDILDRIFRRFCIGK